MEPNNFLGSAQKLSEGSDPAVVRDGATVLGTIAPPSFSYRFPDTDFYSFHAGSGQMLTIHVQDTGLFNAVLTVVSPSFKVKAEKVAAAGQQVRLENLLLDETGTWAVVVTPFDVRIGNPQATDFGSLAASGSRLFSPPGGSYTLVITPATPPVQQMAIEIKPGSGARAPINPKSHGVIPVALLAAPDFDPFRIDVGSLTFGATGEEQSLRRCAAGGLDVDGDGDLDRVCTFASQAAAFTAASTMGYLKGETADGLRFEGQGFLKAVPMKDNK